MKNLIIALIGIFVAIILVSFLWQSPLSLVLCLIIVTIIKHHLSPVPNELAMFFIVGILGPLTESLIMLSGAWSYTTTHLFNFPIWLPFLWGLAGSLFVTIYHSVFPKSK